MLVIFFNKICSFFDKKGKIQENLVQLVYLQLIWLIFGFFSQNFDNYRIEKQKPLIH